MELNDKTILKGIINQDTRILEILVKYLAPPLEKAIRLLINKMGCYCKSEQITIHFINTQLLMIYEDVINKDPAFGKPGLIKSINQRLLENLRLFESFVFTTDENFIKDVKSDAKSNLINEFSAFWKKQKEDEVDKSIIEAPLNKFIDHYYKVFKSKLKLQPTEFLDVSPMKFKQFIKFNLLGCEEIIKMIERTARNYILNIFHQQKWYGNDHDRINNIVSDIYGDALLGFCKEVSERYHDNPIALLKTICYRRVVDHYKRFGINTSSTIKDSESTGKTLAETRIADVEYLLYAQEQDIISYLELKQIREILVNGCKNKAHIKLFRLFLDGWTYEEIAEITDYKSTSAKAIIYEIKQKIRNSGLRRYLKD